MTHTCFNARAAALVALAGFLSAAGRTAAAQAPAKPMPAAAASLAMVTQRGLFIVHRTDSHLLFEIPRRELGRDMVIVRRSIAGGGRGNIRFCRWIRVGNRIVLRAVDDDFVVDSAKPPASSIERVRYPALVMSFEIERFGADSSAVIDATPLFTTGIPEFAGVSGVQGDRTRIERVIASADNVSIIATQTGVENDPASADAGGAKTVRMYWNILRLAETPMRPRLFDPRVDLFHVTARDFGAVDRHEPARMYERKYVERFRLEKRDPNAALSEPVQPIVFWIDPATPPWLVPHVKAGVAEWIPAFEAAGFKNAIVAREATSPAEDPDWSLADARRSVIYWNYARYDDGPYGGAELVDPRSGEILRATANIPQVYLDRMLYRYFAFSGALDRRARFVPNAPDSLVGRLVENVVAHEVGHCIGMPQYASWSTYPVDSLRSATFLRTVGRHVPSIMGVQQNYIAQPEDSVPPDLLNAVVGPYDRDAVRWQYTPLPGAHTPDDERPTLDAWIQARDSMPWRRFSERDGGRNTESVSSYEDGVRASVFGMRNLERELVMLDTMAGRPDADGEALRAVYQELVKQWLMYLGYATRTIGGLRDRSPFGTTPNLVPVSAARQREAMRFIVEHALHTPAGFARPNVLRRLSGRDDVVSMLRKLQTIVLGNLLREEHLDRVIDQQAMPGSSTDRYTLREYLAEIRRGVWTELAAVHPRVDIYRRNVQRAYLDLAKERIFPPTNVPLEARIATFGADRYLMPVQGGDDVRLLLLGDLRELDRQLAVVIPRATDADTKLHLDDMRARIRAMVVAAR